MGARAWLVAGALAGAGAVAAACGSFGAAPAASDGGSDGGSGEPGGSSDASTDGAPADALASADGKTPMTPACATGKVHCNGSCVTGDDCTGCIGAKLFCRGTRACAADCRACPSSPIECFACDTSQNDPIGTCESAGGSFCLGGDYGAAHRGGPAEHCDCSNTQVANCPSDQQVCLPAGSTDWCVTCGESGSVTHGKACKNGGTCDTSLAPPRCR